MPIPTQKDEEMNETTKVEFRKKCLTPEVRRLQLRIRKSIVEFYPYMFKGIPKNRWKPELLAKYLKMWENIQQEAHNVVEQSPHAVCREWAQSLIQRTTSVQKCLQQPAPPKGLPMDTCEEYEADSWARDVHFGITTRLEELTTQAQPDPQEEARLRQYQAEDYGNKKEN